MFEFPVMFFPRNFTKPSTYRQRLVIYDLTYKILVMFGHVIDPQPILVIVNPPATIDFRHSLLCSTCSTIYSNSTFISKVYIRFAFSMLFMYVRYLSNSRLTINCLYRIRLSICCCWVLNPTCFIFFKPI